MTPPRPTGSLADHDALTASLFAHRLLEDAFDRAPTLENALRAEQAMARLSADARRCGMVSCRRDVAGWAARRVDAYQRLLAGGAP